MDIYCCFGHELVSAGDFNGTRYRNQDFGRTWNCKKLFEVGNGVTSGPYCGAIGSGERVCGEVLREEHGWGCFHIIIVVVQRGENFMRAITSRAATNFVLGKPSLSTTSPYFRTLRIRLLEFFILIQGIYPQNPNAAMHKLSRSHTLLLLLVSLCRLYFGFSFMAPSRCICILCLEHRKYLLHLLLGGIAG